MVSLHEIFQIWFFGFFRNLHFFAFLEFSLFSSTSSSWFLPSYFLKMLHPSSVASGQLCISAAVVVMYCLIWLIPLMIIKLYFLHYTSFQLFFWIHLPNCHLMSFELTRKPSSCMSYPLIGSTRFEVEAMDDECANASNNSFWKINKPTTIVLLQVITMKTWGWQRLDRYFSYKISPVCLFVRCVVEYKFTLHNTFSFSSFP